MDVANAGMYDGATSLAEGALMAVRIHGGRRVAVLSSVSPTYVRVLETYTRSQGIEIDIVSSDDVYLD